MILLRHCASPVSLRTFSASANCALISDVTWVKGSTDDSCSSKFGRCVSNYLLYFKFSRRREGWWWPSGIFIALKMEAVRTCETSIYFNETTRSYTYISEGCRLQSECFFLLRRNMISWMFMSYMLFQSTIIRQCTYNSIILTSRKSNVTENRKKVHSNFTRKQIQQRKNIVFRIVFWDVLPCKMIVDRRFRGAYCLHHHTRRRENFKSDVKNILSRGFQPMVSVPVLVREHVVGNILINLATKLSLGVTLNTHHPSSAEAKNE
jgi:hypothetical protein